MSLQTVLHVGPGHRQSGAPLPRSFHGEGWREIRLDIDPHNEPDILGSMLDMSAVASASVDAVYSSHNIEHVHAHEVPQVLAEFFRVLKPAGFVLITCPDLQTVCALVADNKLTEAAYHSQAGPISPLDILYGHGAAIEAGHHFMAHKTGFTEKSLNLALMTAGYSAVVSKRRLRGWDLWALATKLGTPEVELRQLAGQFFPD
jgi:SAM-dependent methyltransferase